MQNPTVQCTIQLYKKARQQVIKQLHSRVHNETKCGVHVQRSHMFPLGVFVLVINHARLLLLSLGERITISKINE